MPIINTRRNEMNKKSILDDFKYMKCRMCGSYSKVTRRSTGSAYHYEGTTGDNDDPNYDTLCEECWKESDEYWQDMWNEYYYNIGRY